MRDVEVISTMIVAAEAMGRKECHGVERLMGVARQMQYPTQMYGPPFSRRGGVANDVGRVLQGLNDIHIRVIGILRRIAAKVDVNFARQLLAFRLVQKNRLVNVMPIGAAVLAYVLVVHAFFGIAHLIGPRGSMGKNPFVFIAVVAPLYFARHHAFEMVVKARMGPEQFHGLGPGCRIQLVVGDQRDDDVAR